MAAQIPVVGGSISYTAPTYNYGQSQQAINGGYTFDLPLATVAAFTNTALTFSAQNSANAQSFFGGVVSQAQSNLSGVSNQTFGYVDKSLGVMKDAYGQAIGLKKYAIKKQYSGCFITTAVTKAAGLPDDTWQLQLLRKFRDDYLLSTEGGKEAVNLYYQIAPAIVAALDASPLAAAHYNYLKCNFIDRAIQLISDGQNEEAAGVYAGMVEVAAKLAGIETLPVTVEATGCTCKGGKRAASFHAKTCPVRNAE